MRCRDGSLYTGIATDVARRVARHAQGAGLGAKYLRGRGPLELVLERRVGAHGLALRVEHRVKRLSKADKEALLTDRRAIGALIARAKKRPVHRAANRPSS